MAIAKLIETYLDSLEEQDFEAVAALLAEDATIEIPFSNTGGLDPWLMFKGKEEALGYIKTIFENFSQVKLESRAVYTSDEEQIVFVEAIGDLVQRTTNASYRNRYVFKFALANGVITYVSEYANPVTFAKLMNMNLG